MKYLVVFLMLLMYTHEAEGQFTGPSSVDRQLSVSDVLDNARILKLRDTQVQLRGFVVEHIREDYFWFEDATGRIRVELYNDVVPSKPFNETTEVILTGDIDFNLLFGTYIWVEQFRFADITSQ